MQGWETWTSAVIEYINKRSNNVVFILWGGYAKKKGAKIDKKRHCVLEAGHPSPLSIKHFQGERWLLLACIIVDSAAATSRPPLVAWFLSASLVFTSVCTTAGCRHFSKANAYLVANGKKAIDWGSVTTA